MHNVSTQTLIKLLLIFIVLAFVIATMSTTSAKSTPASVVKGCDKSGAPIINVTGKIENTVDSGEGGNYWAFDDFNRQIKVYGNGDGTFCVELLNEGQFDSQAGQQSPGDTGTLLGEEDGTFNGGYQATITGTLLATPLWPTKGNVGTVDYQCDISGTCPGYVSWVGQYFAPSYSFEYDFWGWTYNYKNCVWVNVSTGNSGDILCSDSSPGGGGDPT